MGIADDWRELMFELQCFSKSSAKRQWRQDIRYSWGGMCAYCRSNRATTIDHIKPRSKGGSSLRSNCLPCCQECNHSKGSENWLTWYQRQEFYNTIAAELIEEWISNTRLDEVPSERRTNDRTTLCPSKGKVRDEEDEQTSIGEDCFAYS